MKLEELLKEVLDQIDRLNPGEEFVIKDLFRGFEWKRLDINLRRNLGRVFLFKLESGEKPSVKMQEKNSANQQVYKKI